jgi:hypothetical protein
VPEGRHDRRAPVPDEEIVRCLNELLEAERAGVEAALVLQREARRGITDPELKKFAEDEAAACAGLRRAIVRYGGTPSDQTGDFARKVHALRTEGERLSLMARGQAWVVKRLDVLLEMPLDPETQAFLVEMREEHLENVDACMRRAEELEAPPSLPYRELAFSRLREAHDQIFYAPWREPSPTVRDLQRAYHQVGRYLGALADEVQRARSLEARRHLAKARVAYAKADHAASKEADALQNLDNALSHAHSALNALLRHSKATSHNPRDFEVYHDVKHVPFHLIDEFYR